MLFEIEGPFELRRRPKSVDRNRSIDRNRNVLSDFWTKDVDGQVSGLSSACGCYIFAIRSGGGVLPWYVGRAITQKFSEECMGNHQVLLYKEALEERKTGTPVFYFLPRMTPNGSFGRPRKEGSDCLATCALESLLIRKAIYRNPKLKNTRIAKFWQGFTVKGFFNSKKTHADSAAALRDIFRK